MTDDPIDMPAGVFKPIPQLTEAELAALEDRLIKEAAEREAAQVAMRGPTPPNAKGMTPRDRQIAIREYDRALDRQPLIAILAAAPGAREHFPLGTATGSTASTATAPTPSPAEQRHARDMDPADRKKALAALLRAAG